MGLTLSNPYTEHNSNINMDSDEECFQDAEAGPSTQELDVYNNGLFQTDAVKSKQPNIFNPNITFETMRDIESELDFYEKVSLVFLLFDQEDIALQSLLVEKDNLLQQTTTNLLVKWAHSEPSWKIKIIEGLCVIQNYCILERLGYVKEELIASHLPTSPYTASNINILNKALYRFAESLTIDQIRVFLTLLEKDFQKKELLFIRFEDIYVEMYLLQCFSVKYIDKNDISNLISILKKMKLYEQIEMLETAYRFFTSDETDKNNSKQNVLKTKAKQPTCDFDLNLKFNNKANINKAIPGSCSDHSVISRSSLVRTYPSEELYKIDPDNVGICLIINQYEFYVDEDHPFLILAPEVRLENRNGTEFDRNRLKETFTKYNFRIVIKENLTNEEIGEAIRHTMSSFSQKDSCFVVCILSHGEEETVFGVNSIPVNITEIEDILHDTEYPALLGKPKILIIQSCQGKRLQKIVRVEHNYETDGVSSQNALTTLNGLVPYGLGVPQKRDLLLLISTVPGFASIRDPDKGTWFIQELCDTLEERSDENHVEDLMTIVIGKVSHKIWPRNNELNTMVPQKKSTFSKKLFLLKA